MQAKVRELYRQSVRISTEEEFIPKSKQMYVNVSLVKWSETSLGVGVSSCRVLSLDVVSVPETPGSEYFTAGWCSQQLLLDRSIEDWEAQRLAIGKLDEMVAALRVMDFVDSRQDYPELYVL